MFGVLRNASQARVSASLIEPRQRVDKTTGLRSDGKRSRLVEFSKTSRLYPDSLRRIVFYDAENELKVRVSDQQLHAACVDDHRDFTINRWQVELFSIWIGGQNLHIKAFYGKRATKR